MKRVLIFLELAKDLLIGYVRNHFWLFILGLSVGIGFVYVFPRVNSTFFAPTSRTQIIGLTGNYTLSNIPLFIQEKISFGLTKIASDGSVIAGLSKTYEATNSGKTLIFHLDKNLLWQDGSQIFASDLNYRLKGVEIQKNDDEIRFVLKEPFAPLPAILSQPLFKTGLIRKVSFFPNSLNNLFFTSGLIGLGDFRVTQTKFKGRFVSSLELESVRDNSKIIYKLYPNNEAALTALKLGQVNELDNLYEIGELDPKYYSVNPHYLPNTQAFLFFNNNEPFFADKKFRQALTYAISDSFSQGTASEDPLGMNSWARSGANKRYPHSLDEAKTLMSPFSSESGKIKIELLTNPLLRKTAEEIAKSWKDLGISTKITDTDVLPGRFQVYLNLVELPQDPDQYFLWHSTQSTNVANYHSPKVDRLLEDARKTYDQKLRLQNYSDFQKAITEDDPAVFLFYPRVYDVVRKY